MSDIDEVAFQEALADRCEAWKQLAYALDRLLVCYRIGTRPTGQLLNEIRAIKDRLGFDRET